MSKDVQEILQEAATAILEDDAQTLQREMNELAEYLKTFAGIDFAPIVEAIAETIKGAGASLWPAIVGAANGVAFVSKAYSTHQAREVDRIRRKYDLPTEIAYKIVCGEAGFAASVRRGVAEGFKGRSNG